MAREYLAALADALDRDLAAVDAALAADHGDGGRQPVHTVYVPADRFGERTAAEWGATAVEALDRHGDRLAAEVDGVDGAILARVREKLEREPVEDLRVDFEDGYGARPDTDEDAAAVEAGRALAAAAKSGAAPPFTGVPFKCLQAAAPP